jgi:O-antigen/teichoic acid export membrane protein
MNRNYSDRNQDSRQLLSSNVFQTAAMFLPTLIILLFIFSFKENIVPRIFGDGFDSIGAYIPYAILANLPWFFLLLLTSKLLAKVHVREIIFVLVSSMGYFFVVTQLLSDWREYTVLHFALGLTLFFGIEFRNQAIRSR